MAAPASTLRTPRRDMFMARLASKSVFRQGAGRSSGFTKTPFAAAFLDFGGSPGFNVANPSERFIFSTRRPVPEAGGQRPTARCALGRKSVWNICSLAPLLRGEVKKDNGRVRQI